LSDLDLPATALIVKLAAIGDVVMAMPMVSALLAKDPQTRITWMCGYTVAGLVERVDGISEVVPVDEAAMLAGSAAVKMAAVLRAWASIRGRHFDSIYTAHSDPRYRMLGWPTVAKERRWLGGGQHARGRVAGRTYADEYVRLVTGLDDYRATPFAYPAIRVDLPRDLASRIEAFNPDALPLVAIAPGGARNVARDNPLRRWPIERYVGLGKTLTQRGLRVVVVGSASDGWVRAPMQTSSALDLIGVTDLPALAALLKQCAVVVAHDSGPLHLARLVGTPVVSLLGPTPPSMFFRDNERANVLWPGGALPCAPCYDGVDFAKCENNACMKMIDIDSVIERACGLATAKRAH
jgi:ADP-heptose:LPS heptosyltransferase